MVKTDPVPDGQHVVQLTGFDEHHLERATGTSTRRMDLGERWWQNPKNSDEHAGVLVPFHCDFLQQKLACTAAAEHMITQDDVVHSLDCANGVVSEASLPRPS